MHLHGFTRIGSAVRANCNLVSGLRLLRSVRCITTKQPTKATAAAATKPDLYDGEDFENKLISSEDNGHEVEPPSGSSSLPKGEKWQRTTTKKWSKIEDRFLVHTCETKEECYKRARDTFVDYAPDADIAITMSPCEERSIFHLLNRGKGLDLNKIELYRTFLKFDVAKLAIYRSEFKMEDYIQDQTFRNDRTLAVGPELAAAHFMVFRGGKVRFHGHSAWVQMDDEDEYDLPRVFVDDLFVKDIDASGTDLIYEGLENFKGCQHLESLNISRCQYADNCFLDRICLQHAHTLKSLDISHCRNISVGGITALCRLKALQHLNVEGLRIPYLALACLTLEDEVPGLEVSGVNYFLDELDMLPDSEVELVNSRLADVRNIADVKRLT